MFFLCPFSRFNLQWVIIIVPLHVPHLPSTSPTLDYSKDKLSTLVIANIFYFMPGAKQANLENTQLH